MVAVVSGGGLGLNLGSALVLGGAGMGGSAVFGRQSDRVYVNAATGNLVVQGRDELLAGRGPDAAGLRTYNSLGAFVDDNGDNWMPGLTRKVWLSSGTVNTSGSTAIRRDEDSSEALFTWDARGQLVGQLDGEGGFSETIYDANGNVSQTLRYSLKAIRCQVLRRSTQCADGHPAIRLRCCGSESEARAARSRLWTRCSQRSANLTVSQKY